MRKRRPNLPIIACLLAGAFLLFPSYVSARGWLSPRPLTSPQPMGASEKRPAAQSTPTPRPTPNSSIESMLDFSRMPEKKAPGDLGAVDLPQDLSQAALIFERLPRVIAGYDRNPQLEININDRVVAAYGVRQNPMGADIPVLTLQAQTVGTDGFIPQSFSGADAVAVLTLGAQVREDLGREESLFWSYTEIRFGMAPTAVAPPAGTVPADTPPANMRTWPEPMRNYYLNFGRSDSSMFFLLGASDPEELPLLLDAFVNTVNASRVAPVNLNGNLGPFDIFSAARRAAEHIGSPSHHNHRP